MTELHIRIHTTEFTHQQIEAILKPVCDRYIISYETEDCNRPHYQCYVNYIAHDDLRHNKLSHKIRKLVGKGNGKFGISKQRTTNNKIYVCKEKNFIYGGYTPEEIKALADQSYKKPKSFKSQKKAILQLYLEDKIQLEEMIEKQITLITQFEANYNQLAITQYATMAYLKKNPDLIKFRAQKIGLAARKS